MNNRAPTPEVAEWIRSTVKKLKPAPGGALRMSRFQNMAELDRMCYLIAHRVDTPGFKHHNSEKIGFIRGVLIEMAKRRSPSWKSFAKIIDEKRRAYHAKPIQKYRALFLTNISSHFAHWPKSFAPARLLNTEVRFIKPEALSKGVQDQIASIRARAFGSKWPITLGWVAEIDTTGKDPITAMLNAYGIFEHFRAAMNFSELYGRQIDYAGLVSKPMTKFLPPRGYFLFDASGARAAGPWYQTTPMDWTAVRLRPNNIQFARRVMRDMKNEEGTVQGALTRALVMYSQSLDLLEPAQKFLGVWQVIEFLGRIRAGQMKDQEVLQRLRGMLKRNSTSKGLLAAIYEKRNRVVHDGAYDLVGNEDISWARNFAESCMNFYISARKPFPKLDELDTYLQIRDRGDKQLKAGIKVAKWVLRSRVKKTAGPRRGARSKTTRRYRRR